MSKRSRKTSTSEGSDAGSHFEEDDSHETNGQLNWHFYDLTQPNAPKVSAHVVPLKDLEKTQDVSEHMWLSTTEFKRRFRDNYQSHRVQFHTSDPICFRIVVSDTKTGAKREIVCPIYKFLTTKQRSSSERGIDALPHVHVSFEIPSSEVKSSNGELEKHPAVSLEFSVYSRLEHGKPWLFRRCPGNIYEMDVINYDNNDSIMYLARAVSEAEDHRFELTEFSLHAVRKPPSDWLKGANLAQNSKKESNIWSLVDEISPELRKYFFAKLFANTFSGTRSGCTALAGERCQPGTLGDHDRRVSGSGSSPIANTSGAESDDVTSSATAPVPASSSSSPRGPAASATPSSSSSSATALRRRIPPSQPKVLPIRIKRSAVASSTIAATSAAVVPATSKSVQTNPRTGTDTEEALPLPSPTPSALTRSLGISSPRVQPSRASKLQRRYFGERDEEEEEEDEDGDVVQHKPGDFSEADDAEMMGESSSINSPANAPRRGAASPSASSSSWKTEQRAKRRRMAAERSSSSSSSATSASPLKRARTLTSNSAPPSSRVPKFLHSASFGSYSDQSCTTNTEERSSISDGSLMTPDLTRMEDVMVSAQGTVALALGGVVASSYSSRRSSAANSLTAAPPAVFRLATGQHGDLDSFREERTLSMAHSSSSSSSSSAAAAATGASTEPHHHFVSFPSFHDWKQDVAITGVQEDDAHPDVSGFFSSPPPASSASSSASSASSSVSSSSSSTAAAPSSSASSMMMMANPHTSSPSSSSSSSSSSSMLHDPMLAHHHHHQQHQQSLDPSHYLPVPFLVPVQFVYPHQYHPYQQQQQQQQQSMETMAVFPSFF